MALWAPVAIRHIVLYGSVTGGDFVLAYLREHWTWAENISYFVKTFVATAGVHNDIIFAPPKLTVAAAALLAAGAVYGLIRRHPVLMDELKANRAFLWGGLAGAIANLGIVIETGRQGRHIYLMLIPIGLLTGALLRMLRVPPGSPFAAVHLAGFGITYALAFTAYTLATLH
jgi:hypothetical protein